MSTPSVYFWRRINEAMAKRVAVGDWSNCRSIHGNWIVPSQHP